ncbi:hypothetical protein BpHYR1_016723 [Brachionus plicatilis]|uniref:Uncharacterized protein n=1 Tax=Brachionus plicatilis TaxID=10195 RepID=A0A3M7QL84_BRAPC|nr:hypothetical protein BpHYR1_016723 [Brachionus plicatilis]
MFLKSQFRDNLNFPLQMKKLKFITKPRISKNKNIMLQNLEKFADLIINLMDKLMDYVQRIKLDLETILKFLPVCFFLTVTTSAIELAGFDVKLWPTALICLTFLSIKSLIFDESIKLIPNIMNTLLQT